MLDRSCASQVATTAQRDADLTECATSIGSGGTGPNELTAANLPAEVRDYNCRFAIAIADTFKLSHGGSENEGLSPPMFVRGGRAPGFYALDRCLACER